MSTLKFVPFTTCISLPFWSALARRKLNEWQLDETELPIWGTFVAGQAGRVPRLSITEECLQADAEDVDSSVHSMSSLLEARVKGTLKLYNTMEAFQAVNRTQVLDQVRENIEQGLRAQGNNEAAFRKACQFRMLVFADLKKHRFYCHVLHPAVFQPGLSFCFTLGETDEANIRSWRTRSRQQDWGVLMPETADTPPVLIVLDPTEKMEAGDGVLGWPARNALFWCHAVLHRPHLDVCILRQSIQDSVLLRVSASQPEPDAALVVTGWERFDQGGAMLVDLAPLMDPIRLAHDAADLNLKLIKWRLLPELDLRRFSECRALLFGAGTLGCNVTRLLLGWGVQRITLVDNGKVSFSNPPRQSLFRHEDCLHGGAPKATTAALRAREVAPFGDIRGVNLSIPMPGHRIADRAVVASRIEELVRLVEEHDVLFLLTDSRESRWLPTVLGAVHSKLVITIALGFDSYVAMRHGLHPSALDSQEDVPQLGCYFCSDPRVPMDTLSHRTLDQQCTVTRPGVSFHAAAAGVELWASLLQHPLGPHAPSLHSHTVLTALPPEASILGVVPHQVRGYVGHQQMMSLVGEAFRGCSACSPSVCKAVREEGVSFLLEALENADYLAQVSGAAQFLGQRIVGSDGDGDDGDCNLETFSFHTDANSDSE